MPTKGSRVSHTHTKFATIRWRIAMIVVAPLCIDACGRSNSYQAPPPPSVTVSHPHTMPVADYLDTTGSVAAFQAVDLMARVEGYLRSYNFQDGSRVKKNQLLFVIEPEPYQAKLDGEVASLENAQAEYDRQLRMIKNNATSQANVEKWRSQRDQAAASVQLAKINLGYTRVMAPFDGRIDRHLVDPGNLVGTAGSATKLASIEQIDPVYVYFSVNERDLLRIRAVAMKNGKMAQGKVPQVPVELGLQTENGYPHQGTLDFAGNGVDTGSGTLQLRAIVPNPQLLFLPGLFARVRVQLGAATPRMVVPDRVVTVDQTGSYVLTVGKDNKVVQQRIEVGALQNGMRVVLSGLAADSNVVVDGLQYAVPGDAVTPSEQSPTSTPSGSVASGHADDR